MEVENKHTTRKKLIISFVKIWIEKPNPLDDDDIESIEKGRENLINRLK